MHPNQLGTATADDPHKFAGMYLDGESGLYHTWARMYDPQLGRWLAPDPIHGNASDPGSLNRYTYVGNNPLNFNDPLGLVIGPGEPPDPVGPMDPNPCLWADVPTFVCPPPGPRNGPQRRGPGGHGGGRDGGGKADSETDELAKKLLQEYLADFAKTNCAKVLADMIPGFSVSAFAEKALRTNYYNPYKAPFSNYTQDQVTGNGNSTRLWKTFSEINARYTGVVAVTLNKGRFRQTAVLLGPDFFAESADFQTADLVHETIHGFSGFSDPEIFERGAVFGLTKTNSLATEGISNWIKRDCKP
jgi:RHS repeat-associated protein